MSITRHIQIICDERACLESVEVTAIDPNVARVFAERWGWGRVGNDDFCPQHFHEFNEGWERAGGTR